MKTASVLFGLVVTTAGIAHANTRPRTKPVVAKLVPARPIVRAIVLPAATPLSDDRGDMACGNVMTKGGTHHVCHEKTAAEPPVDPVLAAFYAPPVTK